MRRWPACLLVLGLVCASWAADKSEPARFNVGDTVRVMWDGQLVTGIVVGQARSGWFKVKLESYEMQLTPVFRPDRLQLVKRSSPATAKDEVEKEKAGATGNAKTESDAAQRTEETVKVSNGDWSVINNIFVGEVAAWSLKADPAPAPAGGPAPTSRAVILHSTVPSKGKERPGLSNKDSSLLFAPTHGLAFVVTSEAGPRAVPNIRVQRVDLIKGQAMEPVSLPVQMRPMDVDPTGQRILVATDSHVGVWEFNGPSLKMVRTWTPGLAAHAGLPPQPGDGPPRRARSSRMPAIFARFIDADHVLTAASSQLVMWEASTCRAIYKIPLRTAAVTLSPGHKYFVASLDEGLYAFDALTGKALGKFQGEAMRPGCLAFHPAGHRLAGLDQGRLSVWNFDTGEQEREIDPPRGFSSPSTMDWVSANDILIGGRDLVDVKRRIVLWRYQLADLPSRDAKSYGELGESFWYIATSHDRDERSLFPVTLPHDAARSKAANLDPERLLVVKPGAKVQVDVSGVGSHADQEAVKAALTDQLEELGMKVVSSSPVVLTASVEKTTGEPVSDRMLTQPGEPTTVHVDKSIARLRITVKDKLCWEVSSASLRAPLVLRSRPGQTREEALAEYQQRPQLGFFQAIKLPRYVAAPAAGGVYGTSELTALGIKSLPD
jgi:hypothetical protein